METLSRTHFPFSFLWFAFSFLIFFKKIFTNNLLWDSYFIRFWEYRWNSLFLDIIKIQIFAHRLYIVTHLCVNVSKISVFSRIICKKNHENLCEESFSQFSIKIFWLSKWQKIVWLEKFWTNWQQKGNTDDIKGLHKRWWTEGLGSSSSSYC